MELQLIGTTTDGNYWKNSRIILGLTGTELSRTLARVGESSLPSTCNPTHAINDRYSLPEPTAVPFRILSIHSHHLVCFLNMLPTVDMKSVSNTSSKFSRFMTDGSISVILHLFAISLLQRGRVDVVPHLPFFLILVILLASPFSKTFITSYRAFSFI